MSESQALAYISQFVEESLRTTPYACTNLMPLPGGSSNFLYRGTLIKPLADGTTSIIVKHTEQYLFSNKDFKLTPTRAFHESQVLTYLSAFPAQSTANSNITISTPTLLYYDPTTHTQVHSHHPSLNCLNLKSYILKHGTSITASTASILGHSLGHWLKNFHSWANAPAQMELREVMEGNHAMRTLKLAVNYTNLVAMIDRFPKILGSSRYVFEQVEREMLRWIEEGGKGCRELIHGDFWCGNVLLPSAMLSPNTPALIFITDHELSHLASPVFDLAQMCAELFMLTYFKSIPAGKQILTAFLEGYGPIDEDKRWKMMIYIGCHLVGWGPRVAGWGTTEQVEGCVKLGRDLVVGGWRRDRHWCKKGGWEFLIEDKACNGYKA
ncbi:hypothetical protein EYC80_002545 [Monilinia laxa]|uniref:Aminoglycoside phosphotransferase domain-containing protein n=1 Tax=Monilinia laxa TaxID=61186 RepID=A0A5N6K4X6_MONLA|nr:hypothetical protein EYC80_002545 [Monilinia laxa]